MAQKKTEALSHLSSQQAHQRVGVRRSGSSGCFTHKHIRELGREVRFIRDQVTTKDSHKTGSIFYSYTVRLKKKKSIMASYVDVGLTRDI